MFSRHLGEINEMMRPLVYEPDKNLQQQLSNFLTEKVFIEDDDGQYPGEKEITTFIPLFSKTFMPM